MSVPLIIFISKNFVYMHVTFLKRFVDPINKFDLLYYVVDK